MTKQKIPAGVSRERYLWNREDRGLQMLAAIISDKLDRAGIGNDYDDILNELIASGVAVDERGAIHQRNGIQAQQRGSRQEGASDNEPSLGPTPHPSRDTGGAL